MGPLLLTQESYVFFFKKTLLSRGKQRSWTLKKKEIKKNYFFFPCCVSCSFCIWWPSSCHLAHGLTNLIMQRFKPLLIWKCPEILNNNKKNRYSPYYGPFIACTSWPDIYIHTYMHLYYYMRNFCNLIGWEQWYFSLIWNTYMWKLQTFWG